MGGWTLLAIIICGIIVVAILAYTGWYVLSEISFA